MGSREQYESKQESVEGRLEYESKTSSSGSGVLGSLAIGQSGLSLIKLLIWTYHKPYIIIKKCEKEMTLDYVKLTPS